MSITSQYAITSGETRLLSFDFSSELGEASITGITHVGFEIRLGSQDLTIRNIAVSESAKIVSCDVVVPPTSVGARYSVVATVNSTSTNIYKIGHDIVII